MQARQIRGVAPAGVSRPIAEAPRYFSIGLLALRLVVGALFIGHGAQKLFGWFGGRGFAGWTASVQEMGFQPAPLWAAVEAGTEVTAGALLIIGLLTPIAGALLIGDMFVAAAKVHFAKGLWSEQGGFEYNLVLITVLAALAVAGPGFYSVDRRLGLLKRRIPLFVAAGIVTAAVVAAALRSSG